MVRVAGPGRPLVEWLIRECERIGVELATGVRVGVDELTELSADRVLQATGGRVGVREYAIDEGADVLDVAALRLGESSLPEAGTVVVFDPIGGPIAISLAEELGERAVLVTQDQIAGNELSRSGDLAPANVRLAQRGVRVEKRALLRRVRADAVELQDRFSGERREVGCVAVVDCGFRLPTDALPGVTAQIGDCLAPRTIHEAILEARRAALVDLTRRPDPSAAPDDMVGTTAWGPISST